MGMKWEMVMISGGAENLMSSDSWSKLTTGSPSKQDLERIKSEVKATFETLLQSKFGEIHVSMFRDLHRRPLRMQSLRDEIKTMNGGTGGSSGDVFKYTFLYVIFLL